MQSDVDDTPISELNKRYGVWDDSPPAISDLNFYRNHRPIPEPVVEFERDTE